MYQRNYAKLEKEENLLKKAVTLLQETTGLAVDVQQWEQIEELDLNRRADGGGYLRYGNKKIPLRIEIKVRPTKAMIGAIAQQFKQNPERGMLVADYINPAMAARLKELGIWFLDTVGNAYINEPPILVYVKGNRPEKNIGTMLKRRAFQPTGLKVIYAFLCHPELVNAPYRNIAKAAGVALGTVGWVITDLKEMGYIVQMGKKRRLKGLRKLFERWVEAYPDQLRPKQQIGRFTSNEPAGWWKSDKFHNFNAYLGGEIAAEQLTHYLKPEIKTVYVRENLQEIQLHFKMRKDPEGDIELLEAFWNVEGDGPDQKNIVHPILIYADLLATGDPRNIETAEMICETEIAGYFGKN